MKSQKLFLFVGLPLIRRYGLCPISQYGDGVHAEICDDGDRQRQG